MGPFHENVLDRAVGRGMIRDVEQCYYIWLEREITQKERQMLAYSLDGPVNKSHLRLTHRTAIVEIAYKRPLSDPWAIDTCHSLRTLGFPSFSIARSFRYAMTFPYEGTVNIIQ